MIEKLRKRAGRKLRQQGGFTLSELLISILIMLVSSLFILLMLNVGIRQYEAATRGSEQQILCNTISLALEDQLSYANNATFDESGTLTAFNSSATPGLSDKSCRVVLGGYENGSYVREDGLAMGQVLLQYGDGAEDCFPLVSYADYTDAVSGDPVMAASVTVKKETSGGESCFRVRVKVANVGSGAEVSNSFTVRPILKGAIPS